MSKKSKWKTRDIPNPAPVKGSTTTMVKEIYSDPEERAGLSESTAPQSEEENENVPPENKNLEKNEAVVEPHCPKCGADRPEYGFYGDGTFPGETASWTPYCKCGWTQPMSVGSAVAGA
jgi:hypothetical protein